MTTPGTGPRAALRDVFERWWNDLPPSDERDQDRLNGELGKAIEAVLAAPEPVCPHVRTSPEGTSFCALAEGDPTRGEAKRVCWAVFDSDRNLMGTFDEYSDASYAVERYEISHTQMRPFSKEALGLLAALPAAPPQDWNICSVGRCNEPNVCVCGGLGTKEAECDGLRRTLFALQEKTGRPVGVGGAPPPPKNELDWECPVRNAAIQLFSDAPGWVENDPDRTQRLAELRAAIRKACTPLEVGSAPPEPGSRERALKECEQVARDRILDGGKHFSDDSPCRDDHCLICAGDVMAKDIADAIAALPQGEPK